MSVVDFSMRKVTIKELCVKLKHNVIENLIKEMFRGDQNMLSVNVCLSIRKLRIK